MSVVRGEQLSFVDYKPTLETNLTTHDTQPIHIDYLSYSQIETSKLARCITNYAIYIVCQHRPLHPKVLERQYTCDPQRALEGISNKQIPNDKLVYKLLERNWVSEGFISKKQEGNS